jgi:hypothetical protein
MAFIIQRVKRLTLSHIIIIKINPNNETNKYETSTFLYGDF